MKIVPKNWHDFQHYKNRAPPWIKLHHKLLDDFEFQGLPDASKALAPMLWLIGSEHPEGIIDAEPSRLAFRLRTTDASIEEALTPLIERGFFILLDGASNALASRKQDAMPEREREAEVEKQGELRSALAGPVWGESLTILQDQGHSEKTARAFLGMLCRDYEEAEIADAVKAGIGKANITAYVQGVLRRRPRKGESARRVAL